ncbi:MAG: hypothetical protein JST62_12680 [Bacteroidetes bacterium]|jgi:hypothetical protein|nr:hypothetical protein [Bacteroidota bacterium]
MKIFIIDFSDNEDFALHFPKGHEMITEKYDGAMAYKTIGEELPDKIFINYKSKPSHGRQTAISVMNRKKTAKIPIYFVDGNTTDNEKIKFIGTCIKSNDINDHL